MSSQQARARNEGDVNVASETIDDYGDLYPRKTSFCQYTVQSLADGEPTAYRVNIADLTCTCPDFEYNRENGETCKHLSKAIFEAENHWSIEEQALDELSELVKATREEVRDARQAAETCRQHATALGADRAVATPEGTQADSTDSEASESTSEESEDEPETYGVDDPEAVVRAWLEENVLKPAAIETAKRTHDSRVGVGLLPDTEQLNDNQNDQFKDAVKSLDDSECHAGFADDGCYVCGESDGEYFWFIPGNEIEKIAEEVDV